MIYIPSHVRGFIACMVILYIYSYSSVDPKSMRYKHDINYCFKLCFYSWLL